MWFDRFQIADDTPLEQAEAKWVERFKEFYRGDDYEEAAHALGLLVGLPFENSPYIKTIRNEPIQVKGRALVVSRKLVKTVTPGYPRSGTARRFTVGMLQFLGISLEIFLGETEEQKPNGLFILGTARPEWQPHLDLTKLLNTSISTVDQNDQWAECISLDPLPNSDTRQLAQELLQRVVGIT